MLLQVIRSVRLAVVPASLLAMVAALAGCGDFLAIEALPDAGPQSADGKTDTSMRSEAASRDEDGGTGGDAGPSPEADAAVATACTSPREITLDAVADSALFVSGCHGANSAGSLPQATLRKNESSGIFRFQLTPDVSSAVAAGRVIAARLVLDAYPNCPDCSVPVPTVGGDLTTHLMRSDWSEGNGTDYSGADHCRRGSGESGPGWGDASLASPGSPVEAGTDYTAGGKKSSFADGAASITGAIDHAAIAGRVEGDKLSVFVTLDTPGAKVVVATKEAPSSAMKAPPRLVIVECLD